MCLDPRPDRPVRATRPRRRTPGLGSFLYQPSLAAGQVAPVVRASALRALDRLAGDDDLVARGWVVVCRES